MKKSVMRGLTALIVLTLLTACGGGSSGGSTEVSTPPQDSANSVTQNDSDNDTTTSTSTSDESSNSNDDSDTTTSTSTSDDSSDSSDDSDTTTSSSNSNSTSTSDDSSGSSSTSTTSTKDTTKSGYVIDSPVKGLTYICGDGATSETDQNGKFECKSTPITFKVGQVTVGAIDSFTPDKKVYPQDLVGVDRSVVDDERVLSVSRFLQSLDDDGNVSSYINITQETQEKFQTDINITFQDLSPVEKIDLIVKRGFSIKPRDEVLSHLRETLLDNDISPQNSDIAEALSSGDASIIEDINALYEAIDSEVNDTINSCIATMDYLYPNGLESTQFPWIGDFFTSQSPHNIPFQAAVVNGEMRVYSYIGENDEKTRYAILSTNIFRFDTDDSTFSNVPIEKDINVDLKVSTTQLFKWLLKREKDENIFDDNLTIVVNSSYMESSLEQWLDDNSIESNWTISSDSSLIDSGEFDIYVVIDDRGGRYEDVISQGKPMIFFQNGIHPPEDVLSYFDMKWKWYGAGEINNFDSTADFCEKTLIASPISRSVKNLKDKLLDFQYNETGCPVLIGKTTCKDDLLLNSNGKTLGEEFMDGAVAIQNLLKGLDEKGRNVFEESYKYDLFKMVVLLGDIYREEISYPMDKIGTDDTTFYKALFADYTIAYARDNNTYQPDLGDFTLNIDDVREAPLYNSEVVTMTPTAYSEWSATGLYAIPGKTVTIKRTDSSDTKVQMRFNMLRIDTTRLWDNNGYTRPKFIASNPITLEVGKEYKISTPIGGPIYLHWDAVDSDEPDSFSVEISGAGKHPMLSSFDDDSIQKFIDDVASTPFDWLDIKTPYVEIHTLKSKFKNSYIDSGYFPYNGDLKAYLDDTNLYLVINNLNFAGFKGDSLSLSEEVTDWCSDFDLDCTSDIHKKPAIQHINSDNRAECGDGCSGNPFDVSWPVTPTGWGESHEYGHNLQRARLKIYEGRSTEVSNNIFSINTNWKYLQDHNISVHPEIKSPNESEAYRILQEAVRDGVEPSINHPLWVDSGTYDRAGERLSFYSQIAFQNGSWEIFTKLYILERLFTNAIKSDDEWDNEKDTLGFADYTRSEAEDVKGNDFMAITLSKFTGKDYIDYFEAWGISISDKAKDQIGNLNLSDTAPVEFYIVRDNRLTKELPTKALPIDGILSEDVNVSGVCDQTTLVRCSAVNGIVEVDASNDSNLYFTSAWDENGPTSSIDDGEEGYATLSVEAEDEDGNIVTVKLRASKTTTADGINGSRFPMNDTEKIDTDTTYLVVWIDPEDNSFESGKIYKVLYDLYINVNEGDEVVRRFKLNIRELSLPVSVTFDDTDSKIIRGYPELNESQTYFITPSAEQGPTQGVWENTKKATILTVKAKDSDGNDAEIKLRAYRDAYQTDGESNVHLIMNSAIVYGRDNALILEYNSDDNGGLESGETYTASELLVIDARLWEDDKSLRERLYIDVNITAP